MLSQEEIAKVNNLYKEIERLKLIGSNTETALQEEIHRLTEENATYSHIEQKLSTMDEKRDMLLELNTKSVSSSKKAVKTTRSARNTKKS